MAEMYSNTYEPHRFTVADFDRLSRDGYLPTDRDHELLEGGIFEMPQDGFRHTDWKAANNEWLMTKLDLSRYRVVPDETLRLPPYNAPSPDFYIYPRGTPLDSLTGADVALAIEVADTSLDTDLMVKAPIYAAGGVKEYWVVDCATRRVFVHVRQTDGSYPEPTVFSADEPSPPAMWTA